MTKENICFNCNWWDGKDGKNEYGESETLRKNSKGACRVFPPTVVGTTKKNWQGVHRSTVNSFWPGTSAKSKCSLFEFIKE